jgi:hypothetical protein
MKTGLKYKQLTCERLQPARPVTGLVHGAQELTPGEAMNVLMRSAIVVALSMGACTLLAQSLGEVARENRDAPHPRATRVVTNDDIPSVDTMSASAKTNAAEGTRGSDDRTSPKTESKAGSERAAAKASESRELAKTDAEQKKQEAEWNSKFSLQREKISLLERELKVTQQEDQQKQLAHMADVNARLNNQQQYAEAEKLDQEDLAQKQEKLNAEREKLDSMQEEARHAGVKLPD